MAGTIIGIDAPSKVFSGRRGVIGVTTAAAFLLLAAAVRLSAGELSWVPPDFTAAGGQAAAEGKLVHVFVEGDNCPPCDAFKKTHFTDPAYIDFMSTLFVNIRIHEDDPASEAFLQPLGLTHPVVPRFYVLSPQGKGLSMAIGMVAAPPMGGAVVLSMTTGAELPVNKQAAAALAGRLRAHAASLRASGKVFPENALRPVGVAALEAQAWALAGRLDEAEKAFGSPWADALVDRDAADWYVNFWLGWNRNLQGALAAAEALHRAAPQDANAGWLLASAYAANGRYPEAAGIGESLVAANPDDPNLAEAVNGWKLRAGK